MLRTMLLQFIYEKNSSHLHLLFTSDKVGLSGVTTKNGAFSDLSVILPLASDMPASARRSHGDDQSIRFGWKKARELDLGSQESYQGRIHLRGLEGIRISNRPQRYILGHKRLIRSLSWSDDDYGQCVLETLEHLFRIDMPAVELLINHEKLTGPLLIDMPELSVVMSNRPGVVQSPTPAKLSSSEVVRRALYDSEHLMHASGPVSAEDRLHTAMHGYFRSLCIESGIAVPDEASLTLLFKLLRHDHPSLKSFGSYDKDISRVLQGFAQAVDALNSLRNNGSVAHPSDDLLRETEAHLAVNAIRTIFNYISAKVGH